jgi:hypothetical protein
MLEHTNKRRHQRLRKSGWKTPKESRSDCGEESGLEGLRPLVPGVVQ